LKERSKRDPQSWPAWQFLGQAAKRLIHKMLSFAALPSSRIAEKNLRETTRNLLFFTNPRLSFFVCSSIAFMLQAHDERPFAKSA